LITELRTQKPKAIVLDYGFPAKSIPDNVDWKLIEQLSPLKSKQTDDIYFRYNEDINNSDFMSSMDRNFISSVRKTGNVFLPYYLSVDDSNTPT
jgi:hypothetical protein